MSKRIRSRQSAQIDRTNALPENNVADQQPAPQQAQPAESGKVTETCTVTIGPPLPPWHENNRIANAYGTMYEAFRPAGNVQVTTKREGTSNTTANTGSAQRYSWNGFAATAILRWMGANGIKAKAAGNALVKLGVEGVSGATVQTQVQAGRKPDAKLPALTEEQVEQIKAAAA